MRSLNRQRANIVFSTILESGRVLSPKEVSRRERIFERDGVLRWADDRIIGSCSIGASVQTMLNHIEPCLAKGGPTERWAIKLFQLTDLYRDEAFIVGGLFSDAVIVLKQGCTPTEQLKAWFQALLLARREQVNGPDRQPKDDSSGRRLAEVRSTLEETRRIFDTYETRLRAAGWDLDVAALETRTGRRIETETKKTK